MSASKYRLRSNGRNIVKGINTRNIGCSEFKLISVPLGGGYVEAIFLLAEKNCLTFSLTRSNFFFLFSFSCGYGYLLNSENAVTHNWSGVFRFLTASSSKHLFAFHRPLPPQSTQNSRSNMAGEIIDRELLNVNSH